MYDENIYRVKKAQMQKFNACNDIFFPVTALIIQIGLLYIKKKNSLILIIFNICAVFFSFVSIILSILKHNKKVFNIFIEGESKKDE